MITRFLKYCLQQEPISLKNNILKELYRIFKRDILNQKLLLKEFLKADSKICDLYLLELNSLCYNIWKKENLV